MSNALQKYGRWRAFSLLELLVVIAIISLLAAIMLPSLSKAREQAKGTVCNGNLRGLSLAIQFYIEENDGKLLTAGLAHGGTAHDEQDAWVNTLQQNYGNELITRCPSDLSPHWQTPNKNGQLRRVSYALNGYTVHRFGNTLPYDRVRHIDRPAETIYLVDLAEEGDFATADNIHPETWFVDPQRIAKQQVAFERHVGESYYSFIDGHTEKLTFEETYAIDPKGGFPPVFIRNKYDPAIAR